MTAISFALENARVFTQGSREIPVFIDLFALVGLTKKACGDINNKRIGWVIMHMR